MKYKVYLLLIVALVSVKLSQQHDVKGGSFSGSFSSSSSASHSSSYSSSSSGSFSGTGSFSDLHGGLKNLAGSLAHSGANAGSSALAGSSGIAGSGAGSAGGGFAGSGNLAGNLAHSGANAGSSALAGASGIAGSGVGSAGGSFAKSGSQSAAGSGFTGGVGGPDSKDSSVGGNSAIGGTGSLSGGTYGSGQASCGFGNKNCGDNAGGLSGSGSFGTSSSGSSAASGVGGVSCGLGNKNCGNGGDGNGSGNFGVSGSGSPIPSTSGSGVAVTGSGIVGGGSCAFGDKKCAGGSGPVVPNPVQEVPVKENPEENLNENNAISGSTGISGSYGTDVASGPTPNTLLPVSETNPLPGSNSANGAGSGFGGSSSVGSTVSSGKVIDHPPSNYHGGWPKYPIPEGTPSHVSTGGVTSPGNGAGSGFGGSSSVGSTVSSGNVIDHPPPNYHGGWPKYPKPSTQGNVAVHEPVPSYPAGFPVSPKPSGTYHHNHVSTTDNSGHYEPSGSHQVTFGTGSTTNYGTSGSGSYGISNGVHGGTKKPCCTGPFPGPSGSIYDSKPASSVPPVPRPDGLFPTSGVTAGGTSHTQISGGHDGSVSSKGPCCKGPFPGPNGSIHDYKLASSVAPIPGVHGNVPTHPSSGSYTPGGNVVSTVYGTANTGGVGGSGLHQQFPGPSGSIHHSVPASTVTSGGNVGLTGNVPKPFITLPSSAPSTIGVTSTVNSGSQSSSTVNTGSNVGVTGSGLFKVPCCKKIPGQGEYVHHTVPVTPGGTLDATGSITAHLPSTTGSQSTPIVIAGTQPGANVHYTGAHHIDAGWNKDTDSGKTNVATGPTSFQQTIKPGIYSTGTVYVQTPETGDGTLVIPDTTGGIVEGEISKQQGVTSPGLSGTVVVGGSGNAQIPNQQGVTSPGLSGTVVVGGSGNAQSENQGTSGVSATYGTSGVPVNKEKDIGVNKPVESTGFATGTVSVNKPYGTSISGINTASGSSGGSSTEIETNDNGAYTSAPAYDEETENEGSSLSSASQSTKPIGSFGTSFSGNLGSSVITKPTYGGIPVGSFGSSFGSGFGSGYATGNVAIQKPDGTITGGSDLPTGTSSHHLGGANSFGHSGGFGYSGSHSFGAGGDGLFGGHKGFDVGGYNHFKGSGGGSSGGYAGAGASAGSYSGAYAGSSSGVKGGHYAGTKGIAGGSALPGIFGDLIGKHALGGVSGSASFSKADSFAGSSSYAGSSSASFSGHY